MGVLIVALLAVAGMVFSGTFKTGVDFIDGLKFQFSPQLPSISGGNVIFPMSVSVINPSDITMPLDSVFASIYKKEGTEWKYLGSSQPDLTGVQIKANATSKLNFNIKIPLLSAATQIPSLFNTIKGGISDLFNNGNNTDSVPAPIEPSVYKVETRIVIEGQTVVQNFETTI